MEVFGLDVGNPWLELGYAYPPSFSISKGLVPLTAGYGIGGRVPPERDELILHAAGRQLSRDIQLYAERHYGLRISFEGMLQQSLKRA